MTRLRQLRIPVRRKPVPHIRHADLVAAIRRHGLSVATFNRLFGVQTCSEFGPYPWDVEAVLERMMSGKLTGSQREMD